MSFSSFFGKVGHLFGNPAAHTAETLAGAIVGAYNPGLGALIESLANVIYSVETNAAAGTPGAQKKDQVKAIVDFAAPLTVNALEKITGKATDTSTVAPAIDTLIDSIVSLFNALGIFAKSSASMPPAPPSAPAPVPSKVN